MVYRQTPAVKARLDETKRAIVTAATELIHDHGYAGCSMARVAERAGVATGTTYRFFPSKGELFAEVFRKAVAREVTAVTEAGHRALAQHGPHHAALAAVRTFCHRALKSPRLAYALLAEPVDPLVDAERLVFRAAFTDLFAHVVTAGIERGDFPHQNASITGAAIVGAINDVLLAPLTHHADPSATIAELEAFVSRALGATTAPTPNPREDASHAHP
ncbi:TetR/AcrR family transcriptional regulator [Lolliginicoccus suaedae]|uniref:TetR/AcrR family transcriptional regulator n=1 Tax=Lolliginicoccus suaedae TaxID=2605429 RepID=UPI0011ED5840|nr:TetR/AcrR family transcriptional regulator [Lolliginicoccus suaedae]